MININPIKLILVIFLFILVKTQDYCGSYNCYELLGVDHQADQNTIKKAFRQMAKRYHPDKNKQQDTTQLFQFINKAYEILIDEKSRFKYNLYLQNPQESDFYHEYRYYSQKYIQDPQIHPAIVVITLLSLVSILQYVMRKQMYQRAILQITQSHDFKTKVNERCGNNKKIKDEVREEMVKQIQIQGGYSMPQIKDMLICKLVLLPYIVYFYVSKKAKWIYRYNIKKFAYSKQDQQILTIKALNLSSVRWENIDQKQRQTLLSRNLWVNQNLKSYQEQMRQKWLDDLKINNPNRYKMVMKHMAKNQ